MNARSALLFGRRTLPALALALGLGGCGRVRAILPAAKPTREIRALIWSGYISKDILRQFTRETGIEVKIDYFDSNEQLYDILTGSDPDYHGPYDLAMPSDFLAERLNDEGLIVPFKRNRLDHRFTNLTNLNTPEAFAQPRASPLAANFDRVWDLKSDPDNDAIAPYIWGVTGLAYNVEQVARLPMSWASFFTPNPRHRLALVNDGRPVLGSALIYELSLDIAQQYKNAGLTRPELAQLLAKDFANATEQQIERAGDLVKALRSEIVCINSDHIPELLASGQANMAIAWSGDVAVAMLRGQVGQPADDLAPVAPNLNIRISLPQEGVVMFRDCFVIPRQCRHQDAAEQFINFLFDPKVAAEVTNYCCYATTVESDAADVNPRIANSAAFFEEANPNRNIFPEVRSTLERERVFARVWADVLKTFPPGILRYPPTSPPAAAEAPAPVVTYPQ